MAATRGPESGPTPMNDILSVLDAGQQAHMLANRLSKRARHLRKWARREGVSCYRLYDRDIPEIPLAVDWYEGRLHIARYQRESDPGDDWLEAMAHAAADALGVPRKQVYLKSRERQRGLAQYERVGEFGEVVVVSEGGHRFGVNLTDYLDTGLFLDHRITRAMVGREAAGARFLNLFSYTGAFTVYAAAGGARETVSVDLSNRYLEWARHNMELNGHDGPEQRGVHRYVRADVMAYLRDPGVYGAGSSGHFDLAVLDPPTFSTSKKMSGVLDIQRDHVELIERTLHLLRPGGGNKEN